MKKKISVLIVLTCVLLIGLTGCSNASDVIPHEIKVQGTGEVMVEPDVAYLNVNVSVEDKDAKIAQDKAAELMDTIQKELSGFEIEDKDIKTINYSINTIRDYNYIPNELSVSEMPYPVIGYSVENTIKITVKNVDKVGEIMDTVSKQSSVNINGLTFDILDDSKAKEEAIEKAIENAKSKAEVVADSFGVKTEGLSNVVVSDSNVGYSNSFADSRGMGVSMAESSKGINTSISSGEIKVSATVNVDFSFKK